MNICDIICPMVIKLMHLDCLKYFFDIVFHLTKILANNNFDKVIADTFFVDGPGLIFMAFYPLSKYFSCFSSSLYGSPF